MAKDEKDQAGNVILKTAAVGGAAATGALGAMAFAKYVDEPNNQEAALNDDQMDELRAEIREEIVDDVKTELANDEEFREELKAEIAGEDNASRPSPREAHHDTERPRYDNRVDNNSHSSSDDVDDDDEEMETETEHEVEVVDYQTIDDVDGDEVNVAVVKVDGTHVALVDVDGDMNADLMIVDSDGSEMFDEGDAIHDITNEDIDMNEFRDALIPDDDLIVDDSDADFNNDANVDDFIA